MKKKIQVAGIIIDAGTQIREALDASHVDDIAEAYGRKDYPPPVTVFQTFAGGFILADGFHRRAGALQAGLKEIEAEIQKGERIDALKFALSCNAKHGLKRSNSDKRRALEIGAREFPELTDSELADLCGVSRKTVSVFRNPKPPASKAPVDPVITCENYTSDDEPAAPIPPIPPPPPKRVGKDGVARKMPAKPIKAQRKDRFDRVIPEAIEALWDRAAEAAEAVGPISGVKSILQKAQDEQDLAFAEVNFSSAKGHLEQAWADVKVLEPYAVCPSCNGLSPAKCNACRGRGFVSKFYWERCVPEETRKLIENKS